MIAISVKHIFLAMLSKKDMYGYELKSTYDRMLAIGQPLNLGQIYTTLARLERDKLVLRRDAPGEDGKQHYRITGSGREALDEWLMETGGWEAYTDSFSYKLAAMEYLDGAKLQRSAAAFRIALIQKVQMLTHELSGDKDLPAGARLVAERNLYRLEADIKWLDSCLDTIKKGLKHD